DESLSQNQIQHVTRLRPRDSTPGPASISLSVGLDAVDNTVAGGSAKPRVQGSWLKRVATNDYGTRKCVYRVNKCHMLYLHFDMGDLWPANAHMSLFPKRSLTKSTVLLGSEAAVTSWFV